MYKNEKGLWRQSITIDGKRKVFSAKSKHDLMLKIAEYRNQIKYHTPTYESVASSWQEFTWDRISHGTQRCYASPLSDTVSAFGSKELSDIQPQDIQRWLNSLPLSYKSIATRKSIISQIFDFAYINLGLDIRNPCARIKIDPKKPKGHRQALLPEEIQAIRDTKKGEFILAPLILYTGMRTGEALGLTFSDLDFKKKVIHITKSIDHYGNKPVISTTKTVNSVRDVPLLSQLEALLPDDHSPDRYIVSGDSPLTKSALTKRWAKWKKEHGIEIDRHQIRHTYASILYQAGVDPKSAQHLLGHANISTTMDIYTHMSDQHVKDALAKLETITKKDCHE